ncbi:glycosyltransferase family 2 protein [Gemmata sp.]|uniref:glycosyltransferase family 2 protein n=1 Tax=Gemmata sp. TaxID=1914242 RepID=UPI003F719DDF
MSRVGVVAIGRNEGDRLRLGLQSVAGRAVVVYVDSGSTDDSVATARGLGVEVVDLDMSVPFTAARARNAGFDRLRELCPDVEYVQFIDGDCEVAPAWLDRAAAELDRRLDLAAVCGTLRERFPDASIYNRFRDIEWDIPLGEVKACSGNMFVRASATVAVGGFDPGLIAAEDDEFCLRLRRAGWKIVRLPDDMATHDAAMTRLSQWWKRAVRCGYAYANGAALHGRGPERHFVREQRRVAVWGLGVPVAALGLAWPTAGASLALLALYPLQLAKTYWGLRTRVPRRRHALAYAASCVAGRFPEAVGLAKFYLGRARGAPARIIEYKTKGTV